MFTRGSIIVQLPLKASSFLVLELSLMFSPSVLFVLLKNSACRWNWMLWQTKSENVIALPCHELRQHPVNSFSRTNAYQKFRRNQTPRKLANLNSEYTHTCIPCLDNLNILLSIFTWHPCSCCFSILPNLRLLLTIEHVFPILHTCVSSLCCLFALVFNASTASMIR